MRLLTTAAAFVAATAMNTLSVAEEQRRHSLSRRYGRAAWYVHLALVTPPWVVFLASLWGLGDRVRWPLPRSLRLLGPPLVAAAIGIWSQAFRQLGPARTGNGDVFGHASPEPVHAGIFALLENPMYDSYALAFVGTALWKANGIYLLLAAESFVLLNLIEARVENRARAPTQPSRVSIICGRF